MSMQGDIEREVAQPGMPGSVRLAVLSVAAALLTGALYLIAMRGDALLVDLSALGARIFCF